MEYGNRLFVHFSLPRAARVQYTVRRGNAYQNRFISTHLAKGAAMRTLAALLIMIATIPATLFSQTMWQTTREGYQRGQCHLESNSLRITVHQYHIDVEEEAVIKTQGEVTWGDPASLEITGTFQLSPGSAVRSMLLWNQGTILKARLKQRAAADSAYENVVDRQQTIIRPRDPALIEYLGQGRYRYKIYPVSIGNSRKIRILYSIPLHAAGDEPSFEIRTAFTTGAHTFPDYVPVEVIKGNTALSSYRLQYGEIIKTVRSDGVYMAPISSFFSYGWHSVTQSHALRLILDTGICNTAYTASIDSGARSGFYSALLITVPDTVSDMMDRLLLTGNNSSIELAVAVGDTRHFIDFRPAAPFAALYTKAQSPWDSLLQWTVYDKSGSIEIDYQQKVVPNQMWEDNQMLPLLWAAKYSLAKERGSLGALYGFVDAEMSLLALEEDILPAADQRKYADEGVPLLTDAEIIVDSENKPLAPAANIIIEQPRGQTSILADGARLARMVTVTVDARGFLCIDAGALGGPITLALYDPRGRMIASWRDVETSGGVVRLRLPDTARGRLLLRVRTGAAAVTKKLLVE
jgi:hypothetical protein